MNFAELFLRALANMKVFWIGVGLSLLWTLFETGRAALRSRRMAGAHASGGGIGTINKNDSPFVPVFHRALAVPARARESAI